MLKKVQASIPQSEDVNWIIIISKDRDILKKECEELGLRYYLVDCDDSANNMHEKINKAIEVSEPGFFCGLDDDNTFNINMYKSFLKYKDTHDLIIGQQKLKDGTIRPAQIPARCYTDGGQILVSTEIAKQTIFDSVKNDPQADCKWMLDCVSLCKPERILILNEVISNYNFLR